MKLHKEKIKCITKCVKNEKYIRDLKNNNSNINLVNN